MDKPYQRIFTAIIGIPILYLIFYLGGMWFLFLFLALIIIAESELVIMLKKRGYSVKKGLIFLSGVTLSVAAYFGYVYFSMISTAVIIITFLLMLTQRREGDVLSQTGLNLLVIIYLGWFLSHAILLRNIGEIAHLRVFNESIPGLRDAGFFYIVFVVTCTFLNDTAAYYIGKWKGKKRLSPNISPGKTVVGTFAGLISSIITGVVVNLIFGSPLSYSWVLFLGLIVAITAIFGDLFESMIKRSLGVKDSGAILPGHGGILDRFDSLILVFPVSYYLILFYYSRNGVSII
ncbi:MAG: phosphatidate cytidylyltransferase [Deltaproteobacteria bacterium]|nr:phosphatidate cytidylyltransferase [Deltaproteobacteria bacterium]